MISILKKFPPNRNKLQRKTKSEFSLNQISLSEVLDEHENKRFDEIP